MMKNCHRKIDLYIILKFEDANENIYESDMIMSSDCLQRTWKNNFFTDVSYVSDLCGFWSLLLLHVCWKFELRLYVYLLQCIELS